MNDKRKEGIETQLEEKLDTKKKRGRRRIMNTKRK